MTTNVYEQNKLLRDALAYAIWQHEGGGSRLHNHWSVLAREAINLPEPESVSAEKVARAILDKMREIADGYGYVSDHNHFSHIIIDCDIDMLLVARSVIEACGLKVGGDE